jgi:hypothetical protein
MRKIITSACTATLLTAVIIGTWAMTHTTAKSAHPPVTPAAMEPFDMMLKAVDLPVHNIVDAI